MLFKKKNQQIKEIMTSIKNWVFKYYVLFIAMNYEFLTHLDGKVQKIQLSCLFTIFFYLFHRLNFKTLQCLVIFWDHIFRFRKFKEILNNFKFRSEIFK